MILLRRFVWVVVGLLLWAGLVVWWAHSPDICDQPAARTTHHCEGRR